VTVADAVLERVDVRVPEGVPLGEIVAAAVEVVVADTVPDPVTVLDAVPEGV
jgi:hypothetical protein